MNKIFLTSSQDILLCDEAMAKIRQDARHNNYDELRRFILNEETQTEKIIEALSGSSLFAAKTLVEVRVYTDELKAEHERVLQELIAAVAEDTMLSVGLPRLPTSVKKKKWVVDLPKKGGSLQILYPPEGRNYINWLKTRAQKAEVRLDEEALRFLAISCEGDLITADQELTKLALRYPKQERPLTYAEVYQFVSDNSDYAVFALSDSTLAGPPGRCRRIFHRLKAENIATHQINWILTRNLHMLVRLGRKHPITDGDLAAYGIFGPKKTAARDAVLRFKGKEAVLKSLIRLASMADRSAKGGGQEHVWPLLEAIALRIAGLKTPGMLPLNLRE